MITRFLLLFFIVSTNSFAETVVREEVLDVKTGEYEYLDLNRYSKGGMIRAKITVLDYRAESKAMSSAQVGLVSEDHDHKIELYLVNTNTNKGVVLGYRYFNESGGNINRKPLLQGVPEGEIVDVELVWDGAGKVTVKASGITESLNTNIEWGSGYIFSMGTKAKYTVVHSDL